MSELTDKPDKTLLYINIAIVLAMSLRIHGIQYESAWGDEVVTLQYLPATDFKTFMDGIWTSDPHGPLTPVFHGLAYAWSKLAGGTLLPMRMLPLLLSFAALPLIYLVGKKLFGTRAGLIALYLTAVNPLLIYYSQELRFYALVILCALLSLLSLLHALEKNSKGAWILHCCANALFISTHAFTPILFGVEGLYLLYKKGRNLRAPILWGAFHLLLVAGLGLRMALRDYDLGTQSLVFNDALPTWREFGNTILVFTGARFAREDPVQWMPGGLSFDRIIGVLALLIVGLGAFQAHRKRKENPKIRDGYVLGVLWLVFPLVFLYAVSFIWRPVFYYRYILYAALAFPWLLGAALATIHPKGLRIGATVLFLTLMTYQTLALPRPFRADYQTLAHHIAQDLAPIVLVLKEFNHQGATYAIDLPDENIILHHGFGELCDEARTRAKAGETVWVVFYRWIKLDEFQNAITDCTTTRHDYAGMPGLNAYRVVGD